LCHYFHRVNVTIPTPHKSTIGRLRGRQADRKQLVAMQHSLFDLVQDSTIPAHVRAACARAWSDLQERKRVVDGKPLPGQLRPELQALRELRRGRQSAHKALLAINPADLPASNQS
jgi:predicted RNA-binding Zn ribbon-like protein